MALFLLPPSLTYYDDVCVLGTIRSEEEIASLSFHFVSRPIVRFLAARTSLFEKVQITPSCKKTIQ